MSYKESKIVILYSPQTEFLSYLLACYEVLHSYDPLLWLLLVSQSYLGQSINQVCLLRYLQTQETLFHTLLTGKVHL